MSEAIASSDSVTTSPPSESPSGALPEIAVQRHRIPWVATWILLFSLSALTASALVIGLRGEHGFFVPVLAALICILAALFDAWTKRIPNALTYTSIVAGLAINLVSTALAAEQMTTATRWLAAPGASQSVLGFSICAGLGIVGLLIAHVGGGDIKLLAGLGALLGLSEVGYVMIAGLTIALLYALANLALQGRLNVVLRIAAMRMLELLYLRRLELSPGEAENHPVVLAHDSIPMAVPLAMGLVLAQVLHLRELIGGSV